LKGKEKMKITIGRKLFIGFTILLTLMITISVVAYVTLGKVRKSGDMILKHAQELNGADRLKLILLEALVINDYFITGDIQKKEHFEELSRAVEEEIQKVQHLFYTKKEQKLISSIKEQFSVVQEKADEIMKLADFSKKEFVGPRVNGIVNETDIAALAIIESIEDLYNSVEEELKEITKTANRSKLIATEVIIATSLIAIIIGMIATFLLTHEIAQSIQTLTAATKNIAKGNLTQRIEIKSTDEIGELADSFNKMTHDLRQTTVSRDKLIKEITKRKQAEEVLTRLNDCFLGFGPDLSKNIKRITETAGHILSADCVLYKKLEGGLLCTIDGWQMPPDFPEKDQTKGRLCYDVISREESPLIVRDLEQTSYATTDPNVKKFHLKTYIGHFVRIKGKSVGSLCTLYHVDKKIDEHEIKTLSMLAKALEGEEERYQIMGALRESEEKFRSVSASAQDAIILMDNKGCISYWNRAAENIFGYTFEEAMGEFLHTFIVPQRYFDRFQKGFKKFGISGEGPVVGKILVTGQCAEASG